MAVKYLDNAGTQYLVQKVKSAINDVDSSLSTHIADTDIHVTTADKNKWNNQTFVFRYSSTALTASSTNANSLLDNTDNLKVGDKVIDSNGVLFSITAIDTQNSTFTIGTALIDLAQDSDVVHTSGNETISGTKTFGNGTLIVDNSVGSNVHGEIKLNGSRLGYIVADNDNDGVFNGADCGISILLQDSGKPLHIGGYKVDSNGRVFVNNTNKNPVLSITSSFVKASTLVPENDTANSSFRIVSQLDYANGDTSKVLDVRFTQFDSGSSSVYPVSNDKTDLGLSGNRWKGIYATNYYYGANNVEFSTKFVTTDTAQTISGNKTFSSINGVEPSSLSLPSDRSARVDISSYFTNMGNGGINQYTAVANGFIYIKVSDVVTMHMMSLGSNTLSNYADTKSRNSVGLLYGLFPVRKDDIFTCEWYTTATNVTLNNAYFIPCQGNV